MDKVAIDLAKAYTDTELYENALEKAKSDIRVTEILCEIQPIDKMAILEGQVEYSNKNNTVNSTIRIVGETGIARMNIAADGIKNDWNYTKINIRIKNPPEFKQTIKILITE